MCLYPKEFFVNDKSRLLYTDTEGKPVYMTKKVTVACGKCYECLRERSDEWSFRIMDEASVWQDNCFITLTYNNENLPQNGSLVKADLQKFIKRLRRFVEPTKIRFFACGEYGSKGLRPHYHIIVFNWVPPDMKFFKVDSSGVDLFRSAIVENLWPFGFSSVGIVTLTSAKYCSKYMQKLNTVREGCIPPFILMSNRPGIGYWKINPADLADDKIYRDGKFIHLPRYYLKVLEREGHDLTGFIERRCKLGKMRENPELLLQRRKKAKAFLKNPLTKK